MFLLRVIPQGPVGLLRREFWSHASLLSVEVSQPHGISNPGSKQQRSQCTDLFAPGICVQHLGLHNPGYQCSWLWGERAGMTQVRGEATDRVATWKRELLLFQQNFTMCWLMILKEEIISPLEVFGP